jgi:hypothetical protein
MTLRVANIAATAIPSTLTDLTVTNNLTLSAGTANGVLYLNGSKVATSGSALTFDGTATLRLDGGAAGYFLGPTGEMLIGEDTTGLFVGGGFGVSPAIPVIYGSAGTTFQRWLAGGSEAMRLNSTGLGIGVTNPQVKLDVQGTATTQIRALMIGQADTRLISDTGNGILGTYTNHPLLIKTNVNTVATFDTAGNLGLGVTPAAWFSGYKAVQVGAFGGLYSFATNSGLATNAYDDGNWKFSGTGFANRYIHLTGTGNHQWLTSIASGSAGGAITWSALMTLDASGNLGLGVTPSAWGAARKAIQVVNPGQIVSNSITMEIGANWYHNGTNYIYTSSNPVSLYSPSNGEHKWYYAPSGTAGNTISFTQAMTLTAGGRLLIGTTSDPGYEVVIKPPLGAIAFTQSGGSGSQIVFTDGSFNVTGRIQNNGGSNVLLQIDAAAPNGEVLLNSNGVEGMRLDAGRNVVIGTAAIATNAANGFLYVTACAGTPTGTPTAKTGRVPIVVDTTNNKLYFYSGGAWRDAGP